MTLTAQLAPGPRLLPQVSVSPKSPMIINLEMVTDLAPVLVTVTFEAGEGVPSTWGLKMMLWVDSCTVPPMPCSLTTWGLVWDRCR